MPQPDTSDPQPGTDHPATFNEILLTELKALRPDTFDHEEPNHAQNLRSLYTEIPGLERSDCQGGEKAETRTHMHGLSALCLSGGGIRSATFNLGVLQGLARHGLLGTFDYLSSVSGGGYIAGWLRAWMTRAGTQTVIATLASRGAVSGNLLAPEPDPIDKLREYSNYLTPKVGLFSTDTWTAAAIIVRNLLLNWLVLIPVLAAVLTIPQISLLVLETGDWPDKLLVAIVVGAIALELFTSHMIYRARRAWKEEGTAQWRFVVATVLPLWLSCLLLATAAARTPWSEPLAAMLGTPVGDWIRLSQQTAVLGAPVGVWLYAALWCVVIPLAGWLTSGSFRQSSRDNRHPGIEAVAIVASGAIATLILVAVFENWHGPLLAHPERYVILGVPILLAIYLLARALFVGFASVMDGGSASTNDADREWWARLSGWVLLVGVMWLLLSSVCLLGGNLLQALKGDYFTEIVGGMGGLSGILASLLGKGGDTASGRGSKSKTAAPWKQWAIALAAPLFCVCLAILMAYGTTLLGRVLTDDTCLLARTDVDPCSHHIIAFASLACFLLIPVFGIGISVIMGLVVNVNRFSLHGLYRNRLVRAYLGASNSDRHPDPFTGFDPKDNLPLHELWKPDEPQAATRPLPVINVCLNLAMSQEKLAWQQRKAESFSMTPFYCGNFHDGYRSSKTYYDGITLGTALTISGAAANPNMGYHSSPVIMFLMGLFNARLGAWLGNVKWQNKRGATTWARPGPRQALWPLFAELLGGTSSQKPYVNLSDGGHFENLGLYEMVLRRCRYILVSDAGCDPTAAFDDLGNAIRKLRIDFGIPIEFTKKILISPREESATGLYCATATIHYEEVDGDVPPGQLIYIKPALFGHGTPVPYDVYSYSRSSTTFPHESTADQWFSESQFESYRALGLHVIEQITQASQVGCFPELLARVRAYMASASVQRGPAGARLRKWLMRSGPPDSEGSPKG